MPLTHDFKETIRARAQAEPMFRQSLLREAVECLINGDLATGKAVLRDCVNASAGFQVWKNVHVSLPRALCVCWGRRAARPPKTSSTF